MSKRLSILSLFHTFSSFDVLKRRETELEVGEEGEKKDLVHSVKVPPLHKPRMNVFSASICSLLTKNLPLSHLFGCLLAFFGGWVGARCRYQAATSMALRVPQKGKAFLNPWAHLE